ncbi:MAG: heavy metal transporter [Alphaproteobacteria bacterium]|nr:heavy metal transporter [Alphaproteobacteria bacterium]
MKKTLVAAVITAALGLGGLAALVPLPSAAQTGAQAPAKMRTTVFVVDKMTCATCPITVRTAMSRVAGVRSVEVDFATKRATVTFDPARATPEQIAAASANAGYPARAVTSGS